MTEDVDKLLSGVYNTDLIREKQEVSLAAYEEKIVKKILANANLSEEAGSLARNVKVAIGKGRVTFAWFFVEHQNFPVWIAVRKIPYVHRLSLATLFNKFPSSALVETWAEALDLTPYVDKPTGLVFDLMGIQGTQMILHNWTDAPILDKHTKIFREIGTGKSKRVLCLEQFEPFLNRAKTFWTG